MMILQKKTYARLDKREMGRVLIHWIKGKWEGF
jgi:hypothetical protein